MTATERLKRAVRPLSLAGFVCTAASAVVAGHVLTYLIAFLNSGARHAVLHQSGHSYWDMAVAVAVLCGVAVMIGIGRRQLWAANRPQDKGGPVGVLALVSALAALQLLMFTGLETFERLLAGAPLSGLLDHGVFLLGLGVQIVVAVVVALVIRGLDVVAEALASLLHPRKASSAEARVAVFSAPLGPRLALTEGALGVRGPPSS
jgi:hypothetical protein